MKHVRASRRDHDASGVLFDVKASGKIIPVEKKLLFDFLTALFKDRNKVETTQKIGMTY